MVSEKVSIEVESTSAEQTAAIGRAVGAVLAAGDVVALVGGLGAGKTHLSKGIAVGLGVSDDRSVTSPTFVLVNEYEGAVHIFHVDAYRLTAVEDLLHLGFDEMCSSGGVVLVEWADRVREVFGTDTLWIEFSITGQTRRLLKLWTASPQMAQRLAASGLDRRRPGGDKGRIG